MSANLLDGQNYIIFLKLTSRLPHWYGRLVHAMMEFDVQVVPMGIDDLRGLPLATRAHVLCINDSPMTHRILSQFRARYLDFALMRKKIVLYELSSFAPISKKFVFNGAQYYRHIPMPLQLNLLVRLVACDYYNNWDNDTIWPGGRRATLPHQGTSR